MELINRCTVGINNSPPRMLVRGDITLVEYREYTHSFVRILPHIINKIGDHESVNLNNHIPISKI